MAKKVETLKDLVPDTRNANKGTERGRSMVERSLRQYGAGRSVLADKNGKLVAGNKTVDVAAELGLEVEVVHSDGKKLIVVQRDDLDLDSKEGRELALADNRAGELDLEWDRDVLHELEDEGVDVAQFGLEFDEDEADDTENDISNVKQAIQLQPAREYVVVMCADDDGEEWEKVKVALGLGPVRRGGYRPGSPMESVATERVIHAKDLLAKLGESC
jgi:hypothetical protein